MLQPKDGRQVRSITGLSEKKLEELEPVFTKALEKVILFVGQAFGGRNHDYAMLKEEFPLRKQWFEDIKMAVDLGYIRNRERVIQQK